jgi:hypothetical protein
MTLRPALLPLLLLSLTAISAFAQSPPTAEGRLQQGLGDLRYHDVPEALRRWFENSPLGADARGQALVAAELEKTLVSYGRIESSEILGERALGEATKRFYFTLICERGPIYGSADAFRTKRGWILTDFQFNTRAGKVFPESMLEP